MTDDILQPDDSETRPDDHQQAIEACEHALDALRNGDLSHALTLLDELDKGASKRELGRRTGVGRSAVRHVATNRDRYVGEPHSYEHRGRKRVV